MPRHRSFASDVADPELRMAQILRERFPVSFERHRALPR
eukprot:SAG31_NODE_30050_length_386_cov_0.710801_1_plen_38_part_01